MKLLAMSKFKTMKKLTSEDVKDIAQYLIIFVLVFGMLTLIWKLFKIKFPIENKEIGLLLIGAFSAKFSDAVGYLLNSSKGSSKKTDIISKSPALIEETKPTNEVQ
jgi:hypothetical protein